MSSRAAVQAPRTSYGIILMQRRPSGDGCLEAILVRGRYSYEYSDFVHGRYQPADKAGIASMFNAMSVNERLDIMSLNFAQMWYRIWLSAGSTELYHRKHAKFASIWLRRDGGAALKALIKSSLPPGRGEDRWEFPKGKRLSHAESEIACAVREFREETGIEKSNYHLIPGFCRRVAYTHYGVRYVNVYFAAVARRPIKPAVDLSEFGQVAEVAEVRWMSAEELRRVDTPTRRLESTVGPAFRCAKAFMRGEAPRRPRREALSARRGRPGLCAAAPPRL